MKFLLKILFIVTAISLQQFASAQTSATATLDTNSILIGDQITIVLEFSFPDNHIVKWPVLTDTIISEIEILKRTDIDTSFSKDNNVKTLTQQLIITSWDSGYYAIPPIRFNYKQPEDTTLYFTETEALLLEVNTVPVDIQKEFKDIKAPMEAPYTLKEALPWILGLLMALALGFVIFYYLKKRKKEEPIFKVISKPKLPPHQIALDALDTLRRKKLWQANRIKEYHTELTDIIRDYIDGKFGIHAMEMTSDDIMAAVNSTPTNGQIKDKLRQTLVLADLVKFAKQNPLPLEHDTSLNNVVDFVKETIHFNNLSEQEEQNNVTDEVVPPSGLIKENSQEIKKVKGGENVQ